MKGMRYVPTDNFEDLLQLDNVLCVYMGIV